MGENSTQCSLCPAVKEFSSESALFLHFDKMHSDKSPDKPRDCEIPKECEICETIILKKNWTTHRNHCQKYTGLIKKLLCVPCNKNYNSR